MPALVSRAVQQVKSTFEANRALRITAAVAAGGAVAGAAAGAAVGLGFASVMDAFFHLSTQEYAYFAGALARDLGAAGLLGGTAVGGLAAGVDHLVGNLRNR
jgi:hypothetical protein